MQLVELPFEHLGSLVQLELREALGKDRLNLIERMGLQEIQDHGIANDKLTVDRFGVAREPFGKDGQVDIR